MNNSKKTALKATGIVGGAQIIQIFIRIINTKIIAILLGPAGVGLIGLFQSTLELVRVATGLGLEFSAVRDVAEASGSCDNKRVERTITILRRWVWASGILGLLVVILLHGTFSQYAFKSKDHALDFLLLSIVPLFTALNGGFLAILRGTRKIGDMARASLMGAFTSLIITIPLYCFFGMKAIVPSLIITALMQTISSCYYVSKTKIPPYHITTKETLSGGLDMVKLGIFTVITGLATTGTMYLTRIFISNKMGVEGVGIFQAAWNLSAIYVGLVLNAMAADYFPRLSAVNQDNDQVCQRVNEQTEIALLLAGPIIIGMICFMDIFISLFYSDKFNGSIDILLWQTMGNLLKIISWPLGFIILAKGKGGFFILSELFWNFMFLFNVSFFWDKLNIEIVGISFSASYLLYISIIWLICRHLCKFKWSKKNMRLIIFYSFMTICSFTDIKFKLFSIWRAVNIVIFVIVTFFSLSELNKIIHLKSALFNIINKSGLFKLPKK